MSVPEGKITPQKSLEIPIRNQKSRTPKQEIPLKNEKSRTLSTEVIYSSSVPSTMLIHRIFCFNVICLDFLFDLIQVEDDYATT